MRLILAVAVVLIACLPGSCANDDPYTVLGLPRDATMSQIRKAYRQLSLKYHPDKAPAGQAETAKLRFEGIGTAYETLSDPDKRQIYDNYGKEEFTQQWQYEEARRRNGQAPRADDFYAGDGDLVTRVDSVKTFDMVNQHPHMIEFYAPWCVHCQQMVEHWEKSFH